MKIANFELGDESNFPNFTIKQICNISSRVQFTRYWTIIPQPRVGYDMVDTANEVGSTE